MPEIQKYSHVEELKRADEKYANSIALAGPSNLTVFSANNAMRTVMFTNHLKQFLNLNNQDFPLVFTNMENMVGKKSDGYKKVKHNSVVYKRINKFEDIVEKPTISTIFLFDKEKEMYKVVERKPVEDLVETFGYSYDNTVIDSLDEGDEVEAGTVLYKSKSYDEDMNYGYGKNVVTMYTLDPFTSEDAAVISKSLSTALTATEVETITIRLNENDFLLNLQGDDNEYKPLPEIGETASGYLAVIRRLFKEQIMFDFKRENLRKTHDGDVRIYLPSGDYVIEDYTIYSNNEEIPEDTMFTAQINKYLRSQNKYYQEIYETCKAIRKSGYKYSKDIGYLYKRSKEMLDNTSKKWKEGDKAFSNIQIEVLISKVAPATVGCKLTGRYGNKSVISQVRDDEDMPVTEDGRRVDLLINLLAIINRTTAYVLYELAINNINYKLRREMAKKKSITEQAKMFFDVLDVFNSEECAKFKSYYNDMNRKERREFIDDVIANGVLIHQKPMFEDESMFFKIMKLRNTYSWIHDDVMYVRRYGRMQKIMQRQLCGEMYIMRLKQTDKRGFSARSTGSIDSRGIPSRNYKSKEHMEPNSNKPIRFGEFETINFSIALPSGDIVLIHALYRTSANGRRDLVKFALNGKTIKQSVEEIEPEYKSIVGEIIAVLFKQLGIRMDIVDPDNDVFAYNDNIDVINYDKEDNKTYICSQYQYELYKRMRKVKKEILDEVIYLPREALIKEIKERMKKGRFVVGPHDIDDSIFLDLI